MIVLIPSQTILSENSNLILLQNQKRMFQGGDFLTKQSKKVFFKETLEADNLMFEKDTCFPEAYKIFFPLDTIPDSKWENCLNKMSEMAKTYLGRKITLEGDKLVLVGTLDDINSEMFEKLQKILDDINGCVEQSK